MAKKDVTLTVGAETTDLQKKLAETAKGLNDLTDKAVSGSKARKDAQMAEVKGLDDLLRANAMSLEELIQLLTQIVENKGIDGLKQQAAGAKEEFKQLAQAAEKANAASKEMAKAKTSQASGQLSGDRVNEGFLASLANITLIITRLLSLAEQLGRIGETTEKISKAFGKIQGGVLGVNKVINKQIDIVNNVRDTYNKFINSIQEKSKAAAKSVETSTVKAINKVADAAENANKKLGKTAQESKKAVDTTAASMSKMPKGGGIDTIGGALGNLGPAAKNAATAVGGLGATVGTAVVAFTAATAVIGGAALALSKLSDISLSAAESQVAYIDQLDKLSKETGLGISTTQQLGDAFKNAGKDASALTEITKSLSAQLLAAANGSAQAQSDLAALGVTNFTDLNIAVDQLLKGIDKTAAGIDRTNVLSRVLGDTGAEGIDEIARKYKDAGVNIQAFGTGLDAQTVKSAKAFKDAQRTLDTVFNAITANIGNAVIPSLAEATQQVAEFAAEFVSIPGVIEGFRTFGEIIALTVTGIKQLTTAASTAIQVIQVVGEELGITKDILLAAAGPLLLLTNAYELIERTVGDGERAFSDSAKAAEESGAKTKLAANAAQKALEAEKAATEALTTAIKTQIEAILARNQANLLSINNSTETAKIAAKQAINDAAVLNARLLEIDIQGNEKRINELRATNSNILDLATILKGQLIALEKGKAAAVSNEVKAEFDARIKATKEGLDQLNKESINKQNEQTALRITQFGQQVDQQRAALNQQLENLRNNADEQLAIINENEAAIMEAQRQGVITAEQAQDALLQAVKDRAKAELELAIQTNDELVKSNKASTMELIASGNAIVDARKRIADAEVAIENAKQQRIIDKAKLASEEQIRLAEKRVTDAENKAADLQLLVDQGKLAEIDAQKQILDAAINTARAQRDAKRTQINATIEDINREIAAAKKRNASEIEIGQLLLRRKQAQDELNQAAIDSNREINKLIAEQAALYRDTAAAIDEQNDRVAALAGSIETVSVASKQAGLTIASFIEEFSKIEFDPNNLDAAEKRLAQIRSRIDEIAAAQTKQITTLGQFVLAVAQNAESALSEKIFQERDRLFRAQLDRDAANTQASFNTLLDLAEKFQKDLNDLEQKSVNKRKEIKQQIVKAEKDNQEKISELTDQFNNTETEKLADFEKKKEDITKEFNDRAIQQANDLARALQDAGQTREEAFNESITKSILEQADAIDELNKALKDPAVAKDQAKIAELRAKIAKIQEDRERQKALNEKKRENEKTAREESSSKEEFEARRQTLNEITDLEAEKERKVKELRDKGLADLADALEKSLNAEIELRKKRLEQIAADAKAAQELEKKQKADALAALEKQFEDERTARLNAFNQAKSDLEMALADQEKALRDSLAAEREAFKEQRKKLVDDNAAAFAAIRQQFGLTTDSFKGLVANIVSGSGEIGKAVFEAVKAIISSEDKAAANKPVTSTNNATSGNGFNLTATGGQGANNATFTPAPPPPPASAPVINIDMPVSINMPGLSSATGSGLAKELQFALSQKLPKLVERIVNQVLEKKERELNNSDIIEQGPTLLNNI